MLSITRAADGQLPTFPTFGISAMCWYIHDEEGSSHAEMRVLSEKLQSDHVDHWIFKWGQFFSLPSSTRQIAAESFTLTLIGLESSQALKRKCNWITPSSGGGGNGTHLKINLAIDFIKIRWVEVFWAVLLGNLGSQMTFLPKNKIPTTVLFRVLDGLLLPKYFPVIKTKSFLIRIIELFLRDCIRLLFFSISKSKPTPLWN